MTVGRRFKPGAIIGALCFVLWIPASAGAIPASTPAVSGPPNSVAVLGDSISAGTGTSGLPSAEQPANSWATGTANQSVYQRLLAINPAISGNNHNLAANGKKMQDLDDQANSLPANTGLVLIQMGGNDLCRDTAAEMPTPAQYRAWFVEGLNAIAAKTPNGRISVSSIPDIYNLWFLRGAPNPPNSQPSSRASTARFFWDTLAVIPCKSMVDNPTDMSAGAIARRETVRQRNIDYNTVLAEECALRLRCRFDGNATFNFSSNRLNPPYGDLKPRAEWGFVDDDISTIDHFHPSNSGQRKLADASWNAGFNYGDTQPPAVSSSTVTPAPLPGGTNPTTPTANVAYSDAGGVRGIEYRLRTENVAGAWSSTTASSISVPVINPGAYFLETRAIDVNGNLSASSMRQVTFDPATVPAPQITGAPSGPVNTAPSFQFSGTPGLGFECAVDGGSYSPCASPAEVSGQTEGGHTFSVRQIGTTGVRGPADQKSFTIDLTSPGAPVFSGAPTGSVKVTTASIAFTGEPQATFECKLDTGAFGNCTSPRDLSALSEGGHTLSVRQTDRAGNLGPVGSVSWTVDTIAPALPVLTGTPSARSNERNPSLSFTGEAGGSFQCATDSGNFETCASPRALSGLNDGPHTFSVRQTDDAGNVSGARTLSWIVDASTPGRPVLSGAPTSPVASSTASISFTGEQFAVFECSLDGGTFAECTSPRALSGLGDGEHRLAVRQTDRAGNTSAAGEVAWTVDVSAPAAPQITAAPSGTTGSTSASVSFGGEPGGTFTCSVDGGPFSGCSSPKQLEGLGEGQHSVAVRQTDAVGNTGPATTAAWTVDIDIDPPTINGKPSALTNSRTASIAFTGASGATFECRLDEAAWSPCSSPLALNQLQDGDHHLSVRQTKAGNVSAAAEAVWTVDATPPAAPVVSPAPPAVQSSRGHTFTVTGEPGATISCRIDGAGWTPCSSPVAVTFGGDGDRRFEARLTDQAGNTGPVTERVLKIDTTAPGAPALSGAPSGVVRSTSASIGFAGEPGARFECRLNGGAWGACVSPWALTGLPQGAQTAEVRQTDTGGQAGPPVSAAWTVDTIAPGLTGKVTAKRKQGKFVLSSKFAAAKGKPADLEYSTAKKKPVATAKPVASRTLAWKPKLTVKSKKKIAWVRVGDPAGNRSPWIRVR